MRVKQEVEDTQEENNTDSRLDKFQSMGFAYNYLGLEI